MKALLINYLWYNLNQLGLLVKAEQSLTEFKQQSGVLSLYERWLDESLRLLVQAGYINQDGDRLTKLAAPALTSTELQKDWRALKEQWSVDPNLKAQAELLDGTVRALCAILCGRQQATEVIFPDSSVSLVENIYKYNQVAHFFNHSLAEEVASCVKQRLTLNSKQPLRLLEIGAGTGSASATILSALREQKLSLTEYCYTDLSRAFLLHAQKHYQPDAPYLKTQRLNIEGPVEEQGFETGHYDIVVASNVLHATHNMRKTMSHTKSLLKRGGRLFMNEITLNSLFNHLTFGLLEGWWRYDDPQLRITGCPGLLPETWKHLLVEQGFDEVMFPCSEALDLGQQIISARSDGVLQLNKTPSLQKSNVETPTSATVPPPKGKPIDKVDTPNESLIIRLQRLVADVLQMKISTVKPTVPFSELGVDSILAVSITRRINKELGSELDITALFECRDIEALSVVLLDQCSDVVQTQLAPINPHSPELSQGKVMHSSQHMLKEKLIAMMGETLELPQAQIVSERAFSEYGLDSILAVNLTRKINKSLNIELDLTALFEASNLAELIEVILQQLPDCVDEFDEPERVPPQPAVQACAKQYHEEQEGIAIVGINCHLPDAKSHYKFWQNIDAGHNSVVRLQAEQFEWSGKKSSGDSDSKRFGAPIDDVHKFDPQFFGITPTEAMAMSPEQRLMLMSVWNAIEDAGTTPQQLAAKPTGVFVAAGPSDYCIDEHSAPNSSLFSSPALSFIPNRISYYFDFTGPSEYSEAACASSLVALHKAVKAINSGECHNAIVGGVHLILSPKSFMGLESAQMLSAAGICQPFQEGADGFVRAEGVATVVLKPLSDAVANHDNIYGVIQGTGVAHGGRGVSLTAPNISGMKKAMTQAHDMAQFTPDSVSYIEAHGIGNELSDATELAAIKSSYRIAESEARVPCYLGNLKPCIGHGEIVSGMAALIKVAMAMKAQIIPGIPGFTSLRQDLSVAGTRLAISSESQPWSVSKTTDGRDLPRRAGINSFGIGGVNAYLLLEEAPQQKVQSKTTSEPLVIVLSAKTESALRARIRLLADYIDGESHINLQDLAYTLQLGRTAMMYRFALVIDSLDDLSAALHANADELNDLNAVWDDVVYWGRQYDDEMISELFSDQTGAVLVKSLVSEGKLPQLARFWTMGADIQWSLLWEKRSAHLISLPGYPFDLINCSYDQPRVKESDGTLSDASVHQDLSVANTMESHIAHVIGVSCVELDQQCSLQDYGMNSLLLLQLDQNLKKAGLLQQHQALKLTESIRNLCAANQASSVHPAQGKPTAKAHNASQPIELIKLNTITEGQPIFWIHGALGSVESYRKIAETLDRPLFGIQAKGFLNDAEPLSGIETIASYYLDLVRTIQPCGPYDIGGFCLGGIIGYEMVRRLLEDGEKVNTLTMIDSPDEHSLRQAKTVPDNAVKNAALQVANMLLFPTNKATLSVLKKRLIHQSELNSDLDKSLFVRHLAENVVQRGVELSVKRVEAFINRNMKIQQGYRFFEYTPKPLPQKNDLTCYYFANKREVFYGPLSAYFMVEGDPFTLDGVDYGSGWKAKLPNLSVITVQAQSHMTLLTEQRTLNKIARYMADAYGVLMTEESESKEIKTEM
ncbi:beta-ketoacyl synthase N-terminal-like domain-containing protein [Motilimonas cestriensis]|uniref:beta-ketoacyl synthase N-terminal-like domain-containing protein n=1 Tax=Motilimonas cestriensis TaxID=2742685 RepID=UPI003DA44078